MRDEFLRGMYAQFFAVATMVSTAFGTNATAQVTQRPSLLMRDIAKVTLDASGRSQITYNPAICRRLGPELCEYFHAHEMGHVNLRHLERGVPAQRAEVEADRYAASHASPAAVAAARRFFFQWQWSVVCPWVWPTARRKIEPTFNDNSNYSKTTSAQRNSSN